MSVRVRHLLAPETGVRGVAGVVHSTGEVNALPINTGVAVRVVCPFASIPPGLSSMSTEGNSNRLECLACEGKKCHFWLPMRCGFIILITKELSPLVPRLLP